MGLYRERVLPRIINVACATKESEPLRRRVCAGLAGDVVEISFGSGLNIPFYPPSVARVAAVERPDVGRQLAGKRLGETSVPVQRSGLDGQSLPFAGSSQAGHCTSSSTAWPRTSTCAAGSGAWSRCRSGSSVAAT